MNSIRCTTCGNPDITKDGEYYVCSVCGNKFLTSSVSKSQDNSSNNENLDAITKQNKKETILNYIKTHDLEEISEHYIKDIENTEFDDSEKEIIENKIKQIQSKIETAFEIKDYNYSIKQYVKWKNLLSGEFKTKLSNIVKETNFPDDNTDISDIYELLIDFLVEMIQYSNDFETSSEFIQRLNKRYVFENNDIDFNNKQIIINDIISKFNKVDSQTNIDILSDDFLYNILTKEQKKEIATIFLEKEHLFNVKSKTAFFEKYTKDIDFATINIEKAFVFLNNKIDNGLIKTYAKEINHFLTNSTNEAQKKEIKDGILKFLTEKINNGQIEDYEKIIETYYNSFFSEEQKKIINYHITTYIIAIINIAINNYSYFLYAQDLIEEYNKYLTEEDKEHIEKNKFYILKKNINNGKINCDNNIIIDFLTNSTNEEQKKEITDAITQLFVENKNKGIIDDYILGKYYNLLSEEQKTMINRHITEYLMEYFNHNLIDGQNLIEKYNKYILEEDKEKIDKKRIKNKKSKIWSIIIIIAIAILIQIIANLFLKIE